MTHTPGKWHFEDENGTDLPLIAGVGSAETLIGYIVRLDETLGDPGREQESLDNAMLIEAAPDLLAALEAMVEDYTDASVGDPDHKDAPAVLRRAMAAISKAQTND